MTQPIQTYNYNWEDLKQDSKNLANKIWKRRFKFILAITKWGLIPSYLVANELWIKVVKTICLSSYKNKGLQWPMVHHKINWFMENIENPKDWLIIDDLSDTWYTLEYIKQEYPSVHTAVLLQKKTGWIKANFFAREVDNIWIKFPY